jgi:hypothetical protein
MLKPTLEWFALLGLLAFLGSRIYRIWELYVMHRGLDATPYHRVAVFWFITTRMLLALDGRSQEVKLLHTLQKAIDIGPAYGEGSFRETYRYLLALWMTIDRFGSDFKAEQFLETCKRLNPSASWMYGRKEARRMAKRRRRRAAAD